MELYLLTRMLLEPEEFTAEQRAFALRSAASDYLTMPWQSTNQFTQECAHVDRMVDEVRRARPWLQPQHAYEEAIQAPSDGAVRHQLENHRLQHTMPFLRIDF